MPQSQILCLKIIVSGFVQGVFFRYSAKEEADKLSLTGSAKNLEDDSVEIIVCGEKEKIDEFINWCRKGPAMAKVERVEAKEIEFQKFSSFEIL